MDPTRCSFLNLSGDFLSAMRYGTGETAQHLKALAVFSENAPSSTPSTALSGSQPLVTLAQRDKIFSSGIHGYANTCICNIHIYSLMKSKIWCVMCTYLCVCPCIYVQIQLQMCALACEGQFVIMFVSTLSSETKSLTEPRAS